MISVSALVSERTAGVALRSTGGKANSAALALGTSAWTPAIVGIASRAVGTTLRSSVATRGATGRRATSAGSSWPSAKLTSASTAVL